MEIKLEFSHPEVFNRPEKSLAEIFDLPGESLMRIFAEKFAVSCAAHRARRARNDAESWARQAEAESRRR